MYKYGQYRPVAHAAEVLGDRWTLLIVRDLLCGAQHFNELHRGLPGISKALLTGRLRRLQQVGVLERLVAPDGRRTSYQLTAAGRELQTIIDALLCWGAQWAMREPDPDELDPILLLWWMRRRSSTYWLILERSDVSVCLKHPGFETDVMVTADLAVFYQVWLGRMTFAEALCDQRIELDAVPALMRDFPRWFAWSPTAEAVRAATENRQHAKVERRAEPLER